MWQAITDIINKAQSELFMFLILLTILTIVVIRPILTYFKNKKEQETNRETNILKVITDNSSIMSELKTLLKESNENCKECKIEQVQAFQRIEDKQENQTLILTNINNRTVDILSKV